MFQVNPDNQDRTTLQIQSKLGNYSLVKHLLDEPKRLFGIEGASASPAPLGASSSRLPSVPNPGRNSQSSQEFKKPGSGPRSSSTASSSISATAGTSSHASHRGGFVKPAEGKPPYGGRGGYPGQPVKHGGNNNDHRSHGLVPAKGPPPPSHSSASSTSVSLATANPHTSTGFSSNAAPPSGGSLHSISGNGSSTGTNTVANPLGNPSRIHSATSRLPRIPLDNVSTTRAELNCTGDSESK